MMLPYIAVEAARALLAREEARLYEVLKAHAARPYVQHGRPIPVIEAVRRYDRAWHILQDAISEAKEC